MDRLKPIWGRVSSYADSISSSVGSLSNTRAAVIGGAIGTGYTSYEQGNISGAVTPNGIINAGIGAVSIVGAKKYGTTIYSRLDDNIMRGGLS